MNQARCFWDMQWVNKERVNMRNKQFANMSTSTCLYSIETCKKSLHQWKTNSEFKHERDKAKTKRNLLLMLGRARKERNQISLFASRLRHLRYSSSNENTMSSSEHASSSSSSSLSLEIVTQGFVRLLSMLAIYFLGSSFLQIGVVGGKRSEERRVGKECRL